MTYSESTVYQRNSKLWFQIWLHSEPQHWETLAGFYPDILFNELEDHAPVRGISGWGYSGELGTDLDILLENQYSILPLVSLFKMCISIYNLKPNSGVTWFFKDKWQK